MSNAIATLVKQTTKAAATAKAAAKPAAKKVAKTVASTKAPAEIAIKHRMVAGRASAGPVLWAHTAAWLDLSGMLKGKQFSKKAAIAVAGATAVNYHIGKGTFEQVGDKIVLTVGGKAHFKLMQAKIDAAQVEAFKVMMQTGKKTAVIRSADHIGPMPAL